MLDATLSDQAGLPQTTTAMDFGTLEFDTVRLPDVSAKGILSMLSLAGKLNGVDLRDMVFNAGSTHPLMTRFVNQAVLNYTRNQSNTVISELWTDASGSAVAPSPTAFGRPAATAGPAVNMSTTSAIGDISNIFRTLDVYTTEYSQLGGNILENGSAGSIYLLVHPQAYSRAVQNFNSEFRGFREDSIPQNDIGYVVPGFRGQLILVPDTSGTLTDGGGTSATEYMLFPQSLVKTYTANPSFDRPSIETIDVIPGTYAGQIAIYDPQLSKVYGPKRNDIVIHTV